MNWSEGKTAKYGLVGLPLSKSSISYSGAAFAPSSIREALQGFTTYSGEQAFDLIEEIIDFGDLLVHPTDIVESQKRLYEGLIDIFHSEASEHWLLLGGDHSVSYSAIKAFQEKVEKVGVIQFDAHHDLRNTEDGGPTNGTPFRRLLEDGIISGKHLVQIGIRDFANARNYHMYAKDHHVAVYTMEDVLTDGIEVIVRNEIERLVEEVDAIYLSVDMDVLDQAFAPGCPAIGPGGMDTNMLLRGVRVAAGYPTVRAMDIVEIDPTIDIRNMTSRVAAYVLLEYMKGKKIVTNSVHG